MPVLLVSYIVVWLYEKPRREAIKNETHDTQVKWLDIQNPANEFNVIIVGSSRGDSAYNPFIIDSIAKTNSYNMCSGSQNIIETYYILKEILKYQKPEIIVYDTFLPSFSNDPDYFHVLSNGKFMSKSGVFDMIFNGFGSQGVSNYMFPILKYKSYFKNDIINSIKSVKEVPDHSYRIQGYYYSDKVIDSISISKFGSLYSFKNMSISKEKTEHYISLISELCTTNGVTFLPIRAPYPPTRIKENGSDSVHFYFENLYNKLGIDFYDFNHINDTLFIDSDFSDHHHLNYMGATKVSKELGMLVDTIVNNEKSLLK